jgi:16S rRNA (guanine527-N7)-methyltransferase
MRACAVQDEVLSSRHAIEKLGGELQGVMGVDSFSSDGQRTAVVVKKVSATPSQFPRRSGIPKKRPLSD